MISRAPLRKCIATVALSGTLADKLEAAALVGFDGVEVMEADLLAYDGSPADIRRIASDVGITIDLYQPFRDFEAMPDPQRGRNLERAERKFDVMQELGTDLVLVCSNTLPAAIDDPARAAADLAEMAERAQRRGMRVGYEALSWGRHVRLWRQAWDIVRLADHPALGLIVDSFHTLALRDDPAGLAEIPGERIFFVQLADAPLLSLDVLSWGRHHRSFPYQGELPVDGFVRAVLASGYQGPLSLEVFNDHFRAAPASAIARDGLRSLILAEALAGDGDALPRLPEIDGIEFLEFAVDQAARDDLAALLVQIGFHHAGQHRSKDVALYRQGNVAFVLNSEQDTAAAEHFQHHGPSVCADALAARQLDGSAGVEADVGVPGDERVGGEAGIPRRVRHLQEPGVADGVIAERHVARRLVDAGQSDVGLEPLALRVDQGDQRDRHVAQLRRRARDGVERRLCQRVEHAQLAQRGQAACFGHGRDLVHCTSPTAVGARRRSADASMARSTSTPACGLPVLRAAHRASLCIVVTSDWSSRTR